MLTRKRRDRHVLRGETSVPGDKSISHRALILAALARGHSRIEGLNGGDDVRRTAACVAALGADVTADTSNHSAEVEGWGETGPPEPDGVLDAGNSGTTIRVLAGVCAGYDGLVVLTGDDTLRRRPMLRVVAPLRQMGASVDGRRHGDLAPLTIRGGGLRGIDLEMDIASAQVKSAVLLAGLAAEGPTRVTEPHRSRDHTERMLAAAGVGVRVEGEAVSVDGRAEVAAREWAVPGDISSALFLIAAAACLDGSDLTIADVGLNPTRIGALGILTAMGAELEVETTDAAAAEPVGVVRARGSNLVGVTISGEDAATFIDEVPLLAVAATQAQGETIFQGMSELRVKESDRIETMVEGLATLGGNVAATPDGLVVRGPTELRGGEVDSRGDHRVALAFAVAGLLTAERVRIRQWSCIETSFPEFLDVLSGVRKSR
jgi:3-phosphoshikimate 1-carboxyvinyltransferase